MFPTSVWQLAAQVWPWTSTLALEHLPLQVFMSHWSKSPHVWKMQALCALQFGGLSELQTGHTWSEQLMHDLTGVSDGAGNSPDPSDHRGCWGPLGLLWHQVIFHARLLLCCLICFLPKAGKCTQGRWSCFPNILQAVILPTPQFSSLCEPGSQVGCWPVWKSCSWTSVSMTYGQSLRAPPWRRIVFQPQDTRISSRRRTSLLICILSRSPHPVMSRLMTETHSSYGMAETRYTGSPVFWLLDLKSNPHNSPPRVWGSFSHQKLGKNYLSLSASQFLKELRKDKCWVQRMSACLHFGVSWFWFLVKTEVYFWSCFCTLTSDSDSVHEENWWYPSFYRYFYSRHWGSPGSPVVRTLYFHCRGQGLDPWSGNWDPPCHIPWPKTNQNKTDKIPVGVNVTF